jgi:hypothetical protein
MKTVLLIKDIYMDAFESLGHFITKNFFKAFAWFSFGMFAVVLYAFVFRVITGFPFDENDPEYSVYGSSEGDRQCNDILYDSIVLSVDFWDLT